MWSQQTKGIIASGIIVSMIPIWRSGGRGNLTFWGWIWNHTIFGPKVEYVPEEDYEAEICKRLGRRG